MVDTRTINLLYGSQSLNVYLSTTALSCYTPTHNVAIADSIFQMTSNYVGSLVVVSSSAMKIRDTEKQNCMGIKSFISDLKTTFLYNKSSLV